MTEGMMYGKRYIRILSLVAVLLITTIVILISKGYQLDDIVQEPLTRFEKEKSNPISDVKVAPENHHHSDSKPDIEENNDGPKDVQRPAEEAQVIKDISFPLSLQLMEPNTYKSASLKTYFHSIFYKGEQSLETFTEAQKCERLKYESQLELSEQKYLEANFNKVRDAIKENELYDRMLKAATKEFKPSIPSEKQWFRFAGSSVWLSEHKVHFMVSRIMWSPSGIPNKAFASFLYIQLFDEDWNELPEKTLKIPYEKLVTEQNVNAKGSIELKIVDRKIAYREAKFPSFLPITFDFSLRTPDRKYYWGPEDPRILLRRNPLGFDEPLIVFNLKDVKLIKRTMHMFLPFSSKFSIFKKRNEPYANIEKNWTPFFSSPRDAESKNDGFTHLNFIYSLEPLEVLKCDIDTAICDFLQKPEKSDFNYVGPLRGGTQLVQLPSSRFVLNGITNAFQIPENRRIYVGWARTHLNKCGCGESMYRPNLIILTEDYNPSDKKYSYNIRDVSEYFDFNAIVPPWITPELDKSGNLIEKSPKQCEGRNVLIPNSIAYWDIDSVRKGDLIYGRGDFATFKDQNVLDAETVINDYMGVTLSAADSDVSIVQVKGLLNYILKLPGLFDKSDQDRDDSLYDSNINQRCAELASVEYCLKYAERNGGVTKY
ncbi:uncharacterized protein PRCAT00003828001 [Priceomyces carsonii]|uniref:uncharacterized protein n=1 Tax=Priceomyces carsonii TaxID=28549 RepID=UPI002EDA8999|nr:unnamed protein product [Priceomyces carsonii]